MTMKIFLTLCFAAITLTISAIAGEPFTSDSTGTDWRTASLEYRAKYCERMAAALQKDKPGITADYFFDFLQEAYTSSDADVISQKISTMVAAGIAMYQK